MHQLIHPAYIQEMQEETGEARYLLYEQRINTIANQRWVPTQVQTRSDASNSKYHFFAAGVGVGLLVVSALWLLSSSGGSSDSPLSHTALSAQVQLTEPATVPTKLENDVEIMKRIVSGLVETVRTLSTPPEPYSLNGDRRESFPYPVKVTTAKAHLRAGADRAATSLMEVAKDTVLMAFDGTDKWLRVSTVRGEDAWISRSVVMEERG